MPPLLVIAYLRPVNLRRILMVALSAGVHEFYISVDFPKSFNNGQLELHREVVDTVERFRNEFKNISVKIFIRARNVGCAASVLSSCDWFFSEVENGIVLEDDCLPALDFFYFAKDSLDVINSSTDIWLACGTQFAPSELCLGWQKSRYALTWGWVTNGANWSLMSNAIRDKKIAFAKSSGLPFYEKTYWNAGSRRAFSGISEAWDTPLVHRMLALEKYSILPSESLVTNLGNDGVATHTFGNAPGIQMPLGKYIPVTTAPALNPLVDKWISTNFYRIKFRHSITTRFTYLLDFLLSRQSKSKTLIERWDESFISS